MMIRFEPIELDENNPSLVLWQRERSKIDNFGEIAGGHSCGGFSCNSLDGYVQVLSPLANVMSIIKKIANEEFCTGCSRPDLDHGVEPEHREAYESFLRQHGLEPGVMDMLQQAVYPLALSCLNKFGMTGVKVPVGAQLLILGNNCD